MFYSNEEVDELLDAGRTETNEDERFEIYSELQGVLTDEAPLALLFHTNFAIGVNTSQLDNIEVDPIGYIRFEDATFK